MHRLTIARHTPEFQGKHICTHLQVLHTTNSALDSTATLYAFSTSSNPLLPALYPHQSSPVSRAPIWRQRFQDSHRPGMLVVIPSVQQLAHVGPTSRGTKSSVTNPRKYSARSLGASFVARLDQRCLGTISESTRGSLSKVSSQRQCSMSRILD